MKSINCERNDSGISAFFKTILGKYISSANLLHRSALVILLVFLMSSNNCNSFSLFNPLTRADGLYFLITFLMLATLMVVDPEYELKGSSTSE